MLDFKIGLLSLIGAVLCLVIYQLGRWCRQFGLWAHKKDTELSDRKPLFYIENIIFGFIMGSFLQSPFNQYQNCKKSEENPKICLFKFSEYSNK